MTTHENTPVRCFVTISSAHHIDSHRRLTVHSIVNSLEPVIEPSQMKAYKIKRCIVGELSFAGVADILPAVDPWSNDEPLQTFLVLAQLVEIYIPYLCAPGVVPASRVVFRDILLIRKIVDNASAGRFTPVLVIAVAPGFDPPG